MKLFLFFVIAFTASQAIANMLVSGKTLTNSLNWYTVPLSIVYTVIVILANTFRKDRG